MLDNYRTVASPGRRLSVLETNKVLRNTYLLLSATLLFSAFTAWFSISIGAPSLGPMTLLVYMGLLFLVSATRNSAAGIGSVFLLTGFLGFTAAPLVNQALGLSNGAQLVTVAFGLTGSIFIALSAYVINTKADFSFMGGFLVALLVTILLGSIISLFVASPMLHLVLTFGMVLVASGLILFETSQIIHGGETNYIMATVSLYVQLWSLFMNLLQLLMMLSGRND